MQKNISYEKGVIVASDAKLEWLLPFWWLNYSLWNNFPVAFIDFGMSEKAIKWCKQRGMYIRHKETIHVSDKDGIDPSLTERWSKITKYPNIWSLRREWFKKPSAFLLSPFEKTLWLDLDCEVRKDISEIFSFCDTQAQISLTPTRDTRKKALQELGLLYPDENYYNSGVVVFHKNSKIIASFAKRAHTDNHLFFGDQDLLSRILYEEKIPYIELPSVYNYIPHEKDDVNAKIYHWSGTWGKVELLKMVAGLNALPFKLFDFQ